MRAARSRPTTASCDGITDAVSIEMPKAMFIAVKKRMPVRF
jgi:hypothetical protein